MSSNNAASSIKLIMHKTISYLKNRYIFKGSFATNVLTLMTGVVIAQLIPIVILPVLTRIYTPRDFGIFTLYMSIFSIIAIFSTGQYELAIMLPEKEEDAVYIIILAVIICFFVSAITLLIFFFLNSLITRIIGNSNISLWLYFVPLTVFLSGTYQIFYYWLNRKKRYKRLAVNRVLQAILMVSVNLIMGLAGFGASGLIVGNICGFFFASASLGWETYREIRKEISLIGYSKLRKLLLRFRKFPFYSLPADFLNVISNQAPAVFLSSFFGVNVVGFFGLTQRVLGVPVTLISTSLYDVFKERASSDYRRIGNCKEIYLKTLKSLFVLSIVPFLLFFFSAPWLFTLIFGPSWRTAGVYAQILSVMLFLRLIVRPLGYMFIIAEKQKESFFLHIYMVISTIVCLFAGYYIFKKAEYALFLFSINYAFIYTIYLLLSYSFSKGSKNK